MGDDFDDQPDLPWSDSFRVGVAQLDEEHRALADQINEVCRHSRGGRMGEALAAFDSLLAMGARHFENEEAVLRGLTGHQQPLQAAGKDGNRLAQLIDLRQRFQEAHSDDPRLRAALIDWFVRESIGHDAAIKAYFDDRGPRLSGRAKPRKAV